MTKILDSLESFSINKKVIFYGAHFLCNESFLAGANKKVWAQASKHFDAFGYRISTKPC